MGLRNPFQFIFPAIILSFLPVWSIGQTDSSFINRELYAEVLFLKAKDSTAFQVEEEIWKPIHRELIRAGLTIGWDLFEVESTGQEKLEYDYVAMSIFSDKAHASIPRRDFRRAVHRAHPDKTFKEVSRIAEAATETVYREFFTLQYHMYPMDSLHQGDYFFLHMKKVAPRDEEDYLEHEATVSRQIRSSFPQKDQLLNRIVWKVSGTDLSGWDYNSVVVENWAEKDTMLQYERPDPESLDISDYLGFNTWTDRHTEIWILRDTLRP